MAGRFRRTGEGWISYPTIDRRITEDERAGGTWHQSATAFAARTIRLFQRQPHPVRTVTADTGTELTAWPVIEEQTESHFDFCAGLLRVGPGHQREHEWTPPPVSPQAGLAGAPHPTGLQSDRPSAEPAAAEATRLPDPGGML
jgi:hypothetical protein